MKYIFVENKRIVFATTEHQKPEEDNRELAGSRSQRPQPTTTPSAVNHAVDS